MVVTSLRVRKVFLHGLFQLLNTTHQLPSDVAHIPEERRPRPLGSLPESQTEDIPDTKS